MTLLGGYEDITNRERKEGAIVGHLFLCDIEMNVRDHVRLIY